MAEIATECVKHPQRISYWSPQHGKYICPQTHAVEQRLTAANRAVAPQEKSPAKPPISAQFKLVFLTAAGGTLLFILICVAMTMTAGREPPPLYEKVILSLFDLAKIGFGAIVGLLGAQALQAKETG
jgi:hypothetical protein